MALYKFRIIIIIIIKNVTPDGTENHVYGEQKSLKEVR